MKDVRVPSASTPVSSADASAPSRNPPWTTSSPSGCSPQVEAVVARPSTWTCPSRAGASDIVVADARPRHPTLRLPTRRHVGFFFGRVVVVRRDMEPCSSSVGFFTLPAWCSVGRVPCLLISTAWAGGYDPPRWPLPRCRAPACAARRLGSRCALGGSLPAAALAGGIMSRRCPLSPPRVAASSADGSDNGAGRGGGRRESGGCPPRCAGSGGSACLCECLPPARG